MSVLFSGVGRGAAVTVMGFGVTQALRFGTSVVVARLLAPELLGLMVIVNTIRTGVELLSDLGITQSVVRTRNAEQVEFYSTAWTLKIARGILLFILCAVLAIPISHLYGNSELALILPVAGVTFLFSGISSMAPAMLQRRMELIKLNAFEICIAALYSAFQVLIAYLMPTVWAMVFGLLFGSFITMIGSFVLARSMPHKIMLVREHISAILHFGKWIALASVAFFLTTSFDRLYLGAAVPLALLGVYGIARTISEIVASSFQKIGNSVVFPYIASKADTPLHELRAKVAPARARFVALAAALIGGFAAGADLVVESLFDQRYHAAGWMLVVLMAGAWCSVLSSLGDSMLLGLGRSHYGAASNTAKFVFLLVALPLALSSYGMVGAVLVVSASEVARLTPILWGQRHERFSFLAQDLGATAIFTAILLMGLGLRHLSPSRITF